MLPPKPLVPMNQGFNKVNLKKTYNKSTNYISDGGYNSKRTSRSPNRSDVGSAPNININA